MVSSPRHLQEPLGGSKQTLGQYLDCHHLEYRVCENINMDGDVISRITLSTLGLSFGAAWIFREQFINRFGGRLLNLHSTRLPQNRGGGGFSWQILNDNRLGCCLIHQVDTGVDTGPIVKYETHAIERSESDYSSSEF